MMIRSALFALGLAAFIAQPTFADITMVQSVTGPDGGKLSGDLTIRASDSNVRVDMGSEMSTISTAGGAGMVTLMHAQKMAMRMPAEMVQQMSAQVVAGVPDYKPEDFTPTGRSETINGFACEEYKFQVEGQDVTAWFSKELKDEGKIATAMRELSTSDNPMVASMKSFDAMPGVPVRTVIDLPGTGRTTVTIESINTDSIPASTFEVPDGYAVTDMMQMQGAQE